MRRRTTATLVGALLLLAPLSACGQAAETLAEQAIEQGTGADVNIEENGVTVETSEGAMAFGTEGVDLPADWPKELPVYEGKLVSVITSDGSVTAGWETDAPAADAAAAYQKVFEAAGYKVTSTMAEMGGTGFSADGNGYSVVVTATDGPPNMVALMAGPATQ